MRELVLKKEGDSLKAFLLEKRHLVEYHELSLGFSYAIGDILLGEVVQIVKGLNAAFVNVGLSREGFLHYSDIGEGFFYQRAYLEAIRREKAFPSLSFSETSLPKEGKITDCLSVGDWVLVQIVKEMSDTKGPRLTTQISLTGQGLILLPFSSEIGISQRILDPQQRQRWREILRSFYRFPYGIILRTNGQYLSESDLQEEYERLIEQWEKALEKLLWAAPPAKIMGSDSLLNTLLREQVGPLLQAIYTDSVEVYEEVQEYLRTQSSFLSPSLRLHYRRKGIPFELEKSLRLSLGRTVTLPNGAYIVIEHTEALHVIDVNSGSLPAQVASPEEIILQTNLLAAQEIARQLRLRDIGGIIVVDFIDMKSPAHRQLVYERLCEAMKMDRAKHVILQMSEFGLVQITRQRRRPPVELPETAPCPTCKGSGYLLHPQLPLDRIEVQLQYWSGQFPRSLLELHMHPLLAAYWRAHFYCRGGTWLWGLVPHRWLRMEENIDIPIGRGILYAGGKMIATLE
ncbi:MAG: Rne/Rng family ribonuclease [Bacteroidia bacterium]|nr:Rne/Rng family ribonuclease [Bacteroidia bacterium]MDW8133581.1 Rne/Rng family ribonuclease [Bacteroidia bacterium]